jgi:hypothetical protein
VQAREALMHLDSTDYAGDDGLNETGFKGFLISALREKFEISSECQIAMERDNSNYVDLIIIHKLQKIKVLLELKYVRGGFVKEISDKYWSIRKSPIALRENLTDLGNKFKRYTDKDTMNTNFYDSDKGTKSPITKTVSKKLDEAVFQLQIYMRSKQFNDETIYGIAVVGCVNDIVYSELWVRTKNQVLRKLSTANSSPTKIVSSPTKTAGAPTTAVEIKSENVDRKLSFDLEDSEKAPKPELQGQRNNTNVRVTQYDKIEPLPEKSACPLPSSNEGPTKQDQAVSGSEYSTKLKKLHQIQCYLLEWLQKKTSTDISLEELAKIGSEVLQDDLSTSVILFIEKDLLTTYYRVND